MRKILRICGLLLLLVVVVVGGYFLNSYLKTSNRFPYATGTNDKAFLNATWKMSAHEVERANNITLVPNENLWILSDAPSVMDLKRYKQLVQKDVMLRGHMSEVDYSFFDNKLYEYYISLTTYDTDNSREKIRGTLEQQLGKGQPDTPAQVPLIENLKWENSKQKVTMWMSKNEGKDAGYHVGIRATHKGEAQEIEDFIKAEKRSYF